MRKFTLTALVALCAVLPGRLTATSIPHADFPSFQNDFQHVEIRTQLIDFNWGEIDFQQVEIDLEQPEINPGLIEAILKKASLQFDLDLSNLVDQYQEGNLIIEIQVNGYALVETKSGGITIAIIDEF